MKEYWKNFKEGNWTQEIDVKDFINKNYTAYDGDESFLAGTTPKTDKIMAEYEKLYEEGLGKAFIGTDEREQRLAGLRTKRIQKDRGTFYNIENIDVPCITISEEQANCYRIKWFDSGEGMPKRRGGNEDLYKKGMKLAGRPNVLNETAFVLEEGKAGLLKYNYRYTSYHGQWYKCYYVYIVNDNLTQDVFVRTYDYVYDQMADLF